MRGIVKGMLAVLVLGVAVMAAQPAGAAVTWQELTVQDAGINTDGNVELMLYSAARDVAKRFVAAAGEENMILAIGLTALSTGNSVFARTDWAAPGSAILAIRVMNPAP